VIVPLVVQSEAQAGSRMASQVMIHRLCGPLTDREAERPAVLLDGDDTGRACVRAMLRPLLPSTGEHGRSRTQVRFAGSARSVPGPACHRSYDYPEISVREVVKTHILERQRGDVGKD
jgi:hypothetical protein